MNSLQGSDSAPAFDELEVSLFGPGIGECVVIRPGNNVVVPTTPPPANPSTISSASPVGTGAGTGGYGGIFGLGSSIIEGIQDGFVGLFRIPFDFYYGNISADFNTDNRGQAYETMMNNPDGDWSSAMQLLQHPLQGMEATINLLQETMMAVATNIGNVGFAEQIIAKNATADASVGAAAGFFWFLTRKNEDLGDVALGLWRHQATGSGTQLVNFSKHVKAKHYGEIYGEAMPTEELLERMMYGASNLHVNLDGVVDDVGDIEKILRWGSMGIDANPHPGMGNVTNWEIWRIFQDNKLLEKTTFYLNGIMYKFRDGRLQLT